MFWKKNDKAREAEPPRIDYKSYAFGKGHPYEANTPRNRKLMQIDDLLETLDILVCQYPVGEATRIAALVAESRKSLVEFSEEMDGGDHSTNKRGDAQ